MKARYTPFCILIIGFIFLFTAVHPVGGAEWKTYSESGGIFSSGPLPSDIVQALWTDGTDLWVGTYEGIVKYNGKSWSPVYHGSYWKIKHGQAEGFSGNVEEIPDNRINCILDVDDEIWFATDKGIVAYHTKMGQWRRVLLMDPELDSAYIQVLVRKNNQVWIGSWGAGLACYDFKRNSLRIFNKNNEFIGAHITGIATSRDTIWVGTLFKGVNKFNLKTKRWTNLHHKNSILPSNTIKTLAASNEGEPHIWIATDSGLLQIFTNEDSIPIYTVDNSKLPTNEINSILADGDTVWFGTRFGVCTFRDQQWKRITLPSFMKGKRINQIISYRGSIWFATQHAGLVEYTP